MMQNKIQVSIFIAIIVVVVGGAGFGVWYKHKRDTDAAVLRAQQLAAAESEGGSTISQLGQSSAQSAAPANSSSLSTSNATGGSLGSSGNGQGGSSGVSLQTNLGQQSAASSSSQQKIPGPETFSAFDTHKNDTTASYVDLVPGTGTTVAEGNKVAVYYKGWLSNGTLFDQSPKDDKGQLQSFVFTVGQHTVIVGWEEAIVGMKVGGTRRMVIPPSVGYGASGHPPAIPGDSLLVFDVQLLAAQ